MKLKALIKVFDTDSTGEIEIANDYQKIKFDDVILNNDWLNAEIKDLYFYDKYEEEGEGKHSCLYIGVAGKDFAVCHSRLCSDILRRKNAIEFMKPKKIAKYVVFADNIYKRYQVKEIIKNKTVLTVDGVVRPIKDVLIVSNGRSDYQVVWNY